MCNLSQILLKLIGFQSNLADQYVTLNIIIYFMLYDISTYI